ncbi:hypothetical protein [Bradyrhizobium jicamae]|uniref:hypothetical protein n=1 Tax=Bradyrhizobium jicamae TaxID=280332 RepID=UPI001BA7CC4D|nr:hypothetical protein [Bradyrhizobium jicamae]MBR0937885.1 hypothetical protein [Bradyrhizobium jicamae]
MGRGLDLLKDLQAAERLPNVTLLDPVSAEHLTELLAAANVWTIAYRRKMAGVSIPSRDTALAGYRDMVARIRASR